LVGVIVAFLSIFNRELGKKYLQVLKKSWHCFSRRVRLKKCDTNFSEDVKTLLLKKVVIKKPKLVKPLSITIEVASILVVVITVWSLVEAVKAGTALWVFGTCNVSQPSSCVLGAESCSIDEEEPTTVIGHIGRWFEEWGEIFSNIPDRLKDWDVSTYDFTPSFIIGEPSDNLAVELIDPGCSVCMQSYKNILADEDFLANHQVIFVMYPISLPDGSDKFQNSSYIARFILAANQVAGNYDYGQKIVNRIYTEYNDDHIIYQSYLSTLDSTQIEDELISWLKEWGIKKDDIKSVQKAITSDEVQENYQKNRDIVENEIHPKGIPTFIYDNRKHLGLYKS